MNVCLFINIFCKTLGLVGVMDDVPSKPAAHLIFLCQELPYIGKTAYTSSYIGSGDLYEEDFYITKLKN